MYFMMEVTVSIYDMVTNYIRELYLVMLALGKHRLQGETILFSSVNIAIVCLFGC